MFDSDSRYFPVENYQVPDPQGNPVKIKKVRFIPDTPGNLTRQVVQGDRPDLIAFLYYQEPNLFWRIADANQVIDPAQLVEQVGTPIRIPARS